MLSSLNSASIRTQVNGYTENREVAKKEPLHVSKQGDLSRVEQIKESIESGEYKINLQALSEKIAQELI